MADMRSSPSKLVDMQEYRGILYLKLTLDRLTGANEIAEVGDVFDRVIECQATRPSIVLDMAKVTAMSSQMLAKLIAFHKATTKLKGRLALGGMNKSIMPLFEITKLNKLLDLRVDAQEAVLEFQRKPL